jgi:hypothetical protein
MRPGYWLLVLILLLPAPSRAVDYLALSGNPEGTACDIADPGPLGVATVYVLLRQNSGAAAVTFAAPVPPSSGLTHIADTSPYYIYGNSQSGISVGFGLCETSPTVLVMTMLFVRTSVGAPCTPYMASSGSFYWDCAADYPIPSEGVVLNSDGTCSHVTLPSNPVPADGSTNVPLSTVLRWDNARYVCDGMLCGNDDEVYFGTTTDPPRLSQWVDGQASVGPLEPGTTYYWRARTGCPWSNLGPLWSFTTTNEVATRRSTWGAIKALYR